MEINKLIKEIHDNAVDKGFYEKGNNVANLMMLLITEQGEAYDELRKNAPNHVYFVNGKPEGFLVEIADTMIRLLDMIGFLEEEYKRVLVDEDGIRGDVPFDFEHIIKLKMDYNKTRPYRHGGKLL